MKLEKLIVKFMCKNKSAARVSNWSLSEEEQRREFVLANAQTD